MPCLTSLSAASGVSFCAITIRGAPTAASAAGTLRSLSAQALRLFELLGDRRGSGVKRRGKLLVHPEIEQPGDKNEERYRDPEFRLGDEFPGSSFRAA